MWITGISARESASVPVNIKGGASPPGTSEDGDPLFALGPDVNYTVL